MSKYQCLIYHKVSWYWCHFTESENTSELYSLTSNSVVGSFGQVITIELSSEDANMLKNSTIARNESSTFLSLSSSV